MTSFVYLDYAATSAVRPRTVGDAVAAYLHDVGATPGRAGHRLSVEAGRAALRCRQKVARLLNIPGDVGRITFAAHATQALNTAIRGTVRPGDRVIVTAFDHNSVLRPAAALRDVDVVLIAADASGALDEHALVRALDGARLLNINAASNVLGTRLDASRLARLARDAGVLSLVDVAQLAGHAPFDATACSADLIAFTGHKGMLGPQGIGGLWVRDGVTVEPLISGGTGGDSMNRAMPAAYPDHLEAGSMNAPGIVGLEAGLDAVLAEGAATIHARTSALKQMLWHALAAVEGVHVRSPLALDGVPIVTFTASGIDPAALAARLDREHAVLTRAGLHCAPEVHRLLGTEQSGAVRMSLGWASTADDVHAAVAAVAAVVGSVTPRVSATG
jgi:cysteine desulfurase / selenocysteine lyase